MLRAAIVLLLLSLASSARAQSTQPPVSTVKPAAKKPTPAKGTAAARPQTPAPALNGPCIGVFAPIAEHFGMKKIGLTVFGNEFRDLPADSFKFDDLVVERLRAAAGPGVVVRKMSYAKGAFDSFQPRGVLFGASASEQLVSLLQSAVAGQAGCERYVFVAGVSAQYSGNQSVSGVGIVNSGAPILSSTFVHAAFQVTLLEGHTFAIIKRERSNSFLMGVPQQRLGGFEWPDSPEGLDMPRVRTAARALMTETLDKTLREVLMP